MAGRVEVSGQVIDKAGTAVCADAEIVVRGGPRFVSRAGEKLAGALSFFGVAVQGRLALDVGASTGGFVDCLLQNGAAGVIALDVGHGQLDARLRSEARVTVLEGKNARYVLREELPYRPDLLTVDVSFISVLKVIKPVLCCVTESFDGLLLVKPQFEAGRSQVGKRGIVRDVAVHQTVLRETGRFLMREAEVEVRGLCRSIVPGTGGNVEFFYYIGRGRGNGMGLDRLEEVVARCVAS
jgi:23S rRNA (cytidine1920-2'-O)/16S rRNA (cytidine1409-2'-O)-methyltransferase